MSDSMTPDLEARLGSWLAERAPADVPPDLRERITAIPRRIGATGATYPIRMSVRNRRTPTRPMLAVAASVALLTAAIAGGVFLSASRRDAVVPPTRPSLGVLPATIPDDISHGIVDTPLGPARWVHLTGDPTSLPEPFAPIQMPDGTLAWFERGGPGGACYNAPTSKACTSPPRPALSVSVDVLAARVARALPADSLEADLQLIGDTAWFMTSDPVTVWRSSDLERWQQTDVTALTSPGPASIDWTMTLSPQATIGGTTIAVLTFAPTDPGGLLGHPGQDVYLARDDGGGFVARLRRFRRDGGDVDVDALTLEETGQGISFIDGTGREVGHVDGVSREFADTWAQRGYLAHYRLASSDGQRWSLVDLPGTAPVDWPTVVPLSGVTMVYVVESDQRVRAWKSTDGRAWIGGQLLVDTGGAELLSGGITYRDGPAGIELIAYGTDGTRSWRSTDGERWMAGPDESGAPSSLGFDRGWIQTPDQTLDGDWRISTDGTTWEDVPALRGVVDKTTTDGAGGTTEFVIGNAVFFGVMEETGSLERDLWIIEFAP